MDFTPASAQRAAQDGHIETWLHGFLTTTGDNVRFPLALLARCLGPEEGMEYPVSIERWEAKTAAMCSSIAQGWEPPPLLVMYQDDGVLSVRDGNNRHGALGKSGVRNYWTIFWFNKEVHLRQFESTYGKYL
jgi:hypothetical protein